MNLRRDLREKGVAADVSAGNGQVVQQREGIRIHSARSGREDVFVHHTAIVAEGFRTLNQGEKVSCEVVEGPKGLQARNVLRG